MIGIVAGYRALDLCVDGTLWRQQPGRSAKAGMIIACASTAATA